MTFASLPISALKSDSAIGVTYSWEKRTSVRAKNASPGFTADTPVLPDRASVMTCAARIFSQSVMGRAAVVMLGGVVSPLRRARLYANRPPCSTIEALIGSSPLRELGDRDGLAGLDAGDEAEVRRREEADVLRVLPVDLLDAVRDDELDARLQLAVGRGLAARAAALRDTADDDAEAAGLDRVFQDLAAAQADQAVPGEGLVVVVADPAGGQLVGRDVRDQRAIRVEREVLASELLLEERLILGDVEDASLNADRAGGRVHRENH